MPDALTAYRAKRDFGITPEPRGTRAGAGSSFVVQKHAARSLHYDFRLELDGTLKSWAVPKGPSLDPAQKRMAVQVEDHPLSYGGFEGVIPPNQYGAGTVIVWDRGTWEAVGDPQAGYRDGKLKFRLEGEKLHGLWMLVKMHGRASERQQPWLLIKERDEHARPAADYSIVDALPDSVLSGSSVAKGAAAPLPTKATKATKSTATKTAAKTAARTDTKAAAKTTTNAAPKTAAKRAPAQNPTTKPQTRATAAGASAKTLATTQAPPTKRSASGVGTKPRASATEMPQGAVPAALPASFAPELATLVAAAPTSGAWTYEVKFDGYRILARIDDGDVRLVTRNGNDWTARLGGIAREIGRLDIGSGWLDGEIVVLDKEGASDFGALQRAFDADGASIQYFVFDLPYCRGHDLRNARLEDRRALLATLLADAAGTVRFSQDFQADPSELLRNACRLRLEGLIGKRLGSTYVSRRSSDWIKLKCTLRQEFVIGGYTEPQRSRTGLGALLLGIHDERGQLRYAGNVGTGFDTKTLAALRKRLSAIETPETPFAGKPREAKGTWVEPELVAEVSFAEWTRDGKVRHAVYHGLREDKPADAIGRERPAPAPEGASASASASASAPASGPVPARTRPSTAPTARRARPAAGTGEATPPLPPSVRITHPHRVIDPGTNRTKRDLVDYYLQAARRLLPHLAERPVALVRAPAGIAGPHFFQKHSGSVKIEELQELPAALDPGNPPPIQIDTFTAVISAAQMNVVEFHTWNATSKNIEKPDRMTFDLDPGEGVPWARMIEAAKLTRDLLDELGLRSFLKTSGGKGLHVVVPLAPREGWDAVKDFSRTVVEQLAAAAPDRLVAKSGARNRIGRIFVDYLRNGRGATTVAAYSARARPGLGVSMPCAWDELQTLTGGDHWTIETAHERFESADDPWSDYRSLHQSLAAAKKAVRKHAAT